MIRSPRSGYVTISQWGSRCEVHSRFLVFNISAWFNSWMQLECGEIFLVSSDILCKYGRIVHEPEMVCVWLRVLGLCL